MADSKLPQLDIKKLLKLAQSRLGSGASIDDIRELGLRDERVLQVLSDKDKLNEVLKNPEVQELIKKLKK